MMLPSNTTLVNSLYKGFPKWLQRFFDHRSCQIYKHSNTQIETLAKKNKPSVFMKITGLENFEPHHYSMFANALTFVKQETEADDSTCRLFIKVRICYLYNMLCCDHALFPCPANVYAQFSNCLYSVRKVWCCPFKI